jgi:hypothetical protein
VGDPHVVYFLFLFCDHRCRIFSCISNIFDKHASTFLTGWSRFGMHGCVTFYLRAFRQCLNSVRFDMFICKYFITLNWSILLFFLAGVIAIFSERVPVHKQTVTESRSFSLHCKLAHSLGVFFAQTLFRLSTFCPGSDQRWCLFIGFINENVVLTSVAATRLQSGVHSWVHGVGCSFWTIVHGVI